MCTTNKQAPHPPSPPPNKTSLPEKFNVSPYYWLLENLRGAVESSPSPRLVRLC